MTVCPYCQKEIEGSMLRHIGEQHPDKLSRYVDDDDKLMWANIRKRKH